MQLPPQLQQPYWQQSQWVITQQAPVRAGLKDAIWGAGMIVAALPLLIKLTSMFIIYQAFNIASLNDLLSFVGEIKIALIMLAASLLLDSLAILLALLAKYQ